MSTVYGFTNLIQCFQFSGLLSNSFTVTQGAITASFFCPAVVNTGMYYFTGKTLDQLREVLRQIDQLEGQLRGILHTVHNAEDWVAVYDE
jgi:hypothetical protein